MNSHHIVLNSETLTNSSEILSLIFHYISRKCFYHSQDLHHPLLLLQAHDFYHLSILAIYLQPSFLICFIIIQTFFLLLEFSQTIPLFLHPFLIIQPFIILQPSYFQPFIIIFSNSIYLFNSKLH